MKRIISIMMAAVLLVTVAGGVMARAAGEDVSQEFESSEFRALVCESLGKEPGSPFTAEECLAITNLECILHNIDSLAGVEYLLNLEKLRISHSDVREVDLSKNIKLISLDLGLNSFTTLDVSMLTNLKEIDFYYGNLTELDVSNLTQLETLDVQGNRLRELDVSNNKKLKRLWIDGNDFADESAVKGLSGLGELQSVLPGFITITQMPTQLYTFGQEEPSLKGLELTLTNGDFTRSVRYNDLKKLHRSWTYMYEPKAPEHIWSFTFSSWNYGEPIEVDISYGILPKGREFDSFGGENIDRKYTAKVKVEVLGQSALTLQNAKELKPGRGRTALVTTMEEDNIFGAMFGNPLYRFTASAAGEYKIITSGVPKRRSYWIDLFHGGQETKEPGPAPAPPSTEPPPPPMIQTGSTVWLGDGATYYDGKAIPVWVKEQHWIVASLNGDRAVLNQNAAGTVFINSPVHIDFLTAENDYDEYDCYDGYGDYDNYDAGYDHDHPFQTLNNEDGQANTHSIWLEKGETIYLNPYVSPNDEVRGVFQWEIGLPKLAPPFSFKIKIEPVTMESADLQLGKEVPVQVSRKRPSQTFTFTPEVDGNYTFFSSGSTENDPYAAVPYDWTGDYTGEPSVTDNSVAFFFEHDWGMSGSYPRRETKEFMVNMEMQAGQTYSLTVYDHKKQPATRSKSCPVQ